MKTKSTLTEAKDTVVDVAKTGMEGVRDVAGEALGAAAAAAAGVVVVRAAEALLTSGEELKAAAPGVSEAAKETAAAPFLSKPKASRRTAKAGTVKAGRRTGTAKAGAKARSPKK